MQMDKLFHLKGKDCQTEFFLARSPMFSLQETYLKYINTGWWKLKVQIKDTLFHQ